MAKIGWSISKSMSAFRWWRQITEDASVCSNFAYSDLEECLKDAKKNGCPEEELEKLRLG